MKSTHLWFVVLSLLPLTQAHAYDDYEDAPAFYDEIPAEEAFSEPLDDPREVTHDDLGLAQKILAKTNLSKGSWAFKFIFVRNDGAVETLSEYRPTSSVKPASTMKLFTGWMGFVKNAKSDDYLSGMLHQSNNAQASQTLKQLGGTQKMFQFLKSMDLPVQGNFNAVDGSGLSHSNRVTVDLEIQLLQHIHDSPEYNEFKVMLAQPGEDGTLEHRLGDMEDPMYGKTGTLRDTAALAGFVEIENGTLIFSIIANNLEYKVVRTKRGSDIIPTGVRRARPIIDQAVKDHLDHLRMIYPSQTLNQEMIANQPIDNSTVQGENPAHVESR